MILQDHPLPWSEKNGTVVDGNGISVPLSVVITHVQDTQREMEAIHYAAHMPGDYAYGLPSWINQRLYVRLISLLERDGRVIRRSEDLELMMALNQIIKDAISQFRCLADELPQYANLATFFQEALDDARQQHISTNGADPIPETGHPFPSARGPGAPTVEDVERHSAAHRIIGNRGEDFGGLWLVQGYFDRHFGPVPTFMRLRVEDGRVMLPNGFSFWQPLDECRWANDYIYIPLTNVGIPLVLMEIANQILAGARQRQDLTQPMVMDVTTEMIEAIAALVDSLPGSRR